jgi:hypothetical protein
MAKIGNTELSSEDTLRLNVLLANAQAVRIDENTLTVLGLADGKELKVQLNPTCRSDNYISRVRELLSIHALGSPRGYPIHIRRWARMGQINNAPLEKLLLLGEPEAVLAIASSSYLTEEIAQLAWWASPTAEIARQMLLNKSIAQSEIGKVLADYLLEFLPFETEPQDMLNTVRLLLQPGLTSPEARGKIWSSGKRRKAYRIGFLEMMADDIPQPLPASPDFDLYKNTLVPLAESGNAIAGMLLKVFSSSGQTFLVAFSDILVRPSNQDEVSAVLNAVGQYFCTIRTINAEVRDIDWLAGQVDLLCDHTRNGLDGVNEILSELPKLLPEIKAILFLAHVSENLVTPVFALTDAVGTVMRKKIEPITKLLLEQVTVLRTPGL